MYRGKGSARKESALSTRHCWLAHPSVHGVLRAWLTAPGSLSWRIQARCSGFGVTRLFQGTGYPTLDEAPLIGLTPGKPALIREVLLTCSGTPVIFAHSIARNADLAGPWRSLVGLGSRPLATMLYDDPSIRRHPLHYRKLNERHALYRRAAQCLPNLPKELWARRSVFLRQNAPLLVTELFLGEIQ